MADYCDDPRGIFLIVVASFGAWKEQYDARIKAENQNADSIKTKLFGLTLANMLIRESQIYLALLQSPNGADFSKAVKEHEKWVEQTTSLLMEAGFPTDAALFSQAADAFFSPDEIMEFRDVTEWKRKGLAVRARYRNSLEQIISNRRL